MICITGIPGAGKTSVSIALAGLGIKVCDAAAEAEKAGCRSGDTIDVDCMREKGDFRGCSIVQGHMSHYLPCRAIFILEADEGEIVHRLAKREYSREKIESNLDVQRSGILYSESLEAVPSVRIHVIDTTSQTPEETAGEIVSIAKNNQYL